MKTRNYYLFALLTIITLFFINCSKNQNESNEEEASIDDNFEDISKLKTNTQFLSYVSQTLIASQKVVNSTRALEILEIDDTRTDAQNTELATVMGFEDTASMNSHFYNQTQLWLGLNNQFDFNSDAEELELIYQEAVINWLTSTRGSSTRSQKTNQEFKKDEECADFCVSSYNALRPPNEKALKHFMCSESCTPSEQDAVCTDCHTLVDFYLTIQEAQLYRDLQCCSWLCTEDQLYVDNNCDDDR